MIHPKTGYIMFFRGECIHITFTPVFARIPISSLYKKTYSAPNSTSTAVGTTTAQQATSARRVESLNIRDIMQVNRRYGALCVCP